MTADHTGNPRRAASTPDEFFDLHARNVYYEHVSCQAPRDLAHHRDVAFCHKRRMKEPLPDSPGGRLRAARKARRLTLDQLAAELGYSRAHLTHMELNRHRGGRNAWEAIAAFFRLPLDHFLRDAASAAEVQSPIHGAPAPDRASDDERFAELAGQVEDMLRQERMPADMRTVARLTRTLWREVNAYSALMPLEDRIQLVMDQHRAKIARARTAIFLKDG